MTKRNPATNQAQTVTVGIDYAGQLASIEKAMLATTDPMILGNLAKDYSGLLAAMAEAMEKQEAEAEAEAETQPATADPAALIARLRAEAELNANAAKAKKTPGAYATGKFLAGCVAYRLAHKNPGRAFQALSEAIEQDTAAQIMLQAVRQRISYDLSSARILLGEKGEFHLGQSGLLPPTIVEPLPGTNPGFLRALEAITRQQPNEAGQSPGLMVIIAALQGRGPLAMNPDGTIDPASTLALMDTQEREDQLGITRDGTPRPKARSLSKAVSSLFGRVPDEKIWRTAEELKAKTAAAAAAKPSPVNASAAAEAAAVDLSQISWL